jgi:HEAT repeat protein
MINRSILQLTGALCLILAQVVEPIDFVRSETITKQSSNRAERVDQLIETSQTGNNNEKQAAYKELEEFQEAAIPNIPILIKIITVQDQTVASHAATALGQLGDAVIPSLIQQLKDKGLATPYVTTQIWNELGAPAVKALTPLLKDSQPEVRATAALMLGSIGRSPTLSKSIVPNLISSLKDRHALVRKYTAIALGAIPTEAETIVPALIPLLSDQNIEVRKSTAETIGILGQIIEVRKSTAKIIGILDRTSKSAVSALMPLLEDENQILRIKAAKALIRMNSLSTSSIPNILPLLEIQDYYIQYQAIEILGDMGKPTSSTIPVLVPFLKSDNLNLRSEAREALGKMGKAAIPSLVPLLKDNDQRVRGRTAFILGLMGNDAKSAIPDLIPLLKDKELHVRRDTVRAFYWMGKTAHPVIPELIPLLKDNDLSLRDQTISTLTSIGEESIPWITPLLNDKNPTMRSSAEEVLKRIREIPEIKNRRIQTQAGFAWLLLLLTFLWYEKYRFKAED